MPLLRILLFIFASKRPKLLFKDALLPCFHPNHPHPLSEIWYSEKHRLKKKKLSPKVVTNRGMCFLILFLLLTSCLALIRILNSEPQFPHLQKERVCAFMILTALLISLDDLVHMHSHEKENQ